MKKFIAIALSIVMLLTILPACGNQADDSQQPEKTPSESVEHSQAPEYDIDAASGLDEPGNTDTQSPESAPPEITKLDGQGADPEPSESHIVYSPNLPVDSFDIPTMTIELNELVVGEDGLAYGKVTITDPALAGKDTYPSVFLLLFNDEEKLSAGYGVNCGYDEETDYDQGIFVHSHWCLQAAKGATLEDLQDKIYYYVTDGYYSMLPINVEYITKDICRKLY